MRTLLVTVGCVLLLACLPASPEAGFVASPMKVQLDLNAGFTGATTVSIVNTSPDPLTVRVYLADSRFFPDGREESLDAGTMERSCAPWVSCNSQILEFAGKSTVQLHLDVEVPEDAVGSYWAMLYLEQVNLPDAGQRESHQGRHYEVFMLQRLGVRLFVDVLGTMVRDARVTFVDAQGTEDDYGTIDVTIQNVGNTVLRCDGWVEVRQSNGMTADTIKLGVEGLFTVFPRTSRILSVQSDTPLRPDTYTALTVVDFGGPHLVAGEDIFEIKPTEPAPPPNEPPSETEIPVTVVAADSP